MTKHNLSFEDRFMLYVQKSDNPNGCWEWTGSKLPNGYGGFEIKHKKYLSHRVSYALFINMIPDGLEVLHKCDNKSCVNPSHLFLGTQKDNMQDMKNKNRQARMKGETNGSHKLIKQEIYKIREMIEQKFYTQKELANMFGVNEKTIRRIKLGKTWSWLK